MGSGTPQAPDYSLNGTDHVLQYERTGGTIGHDWNGASCLILHTVGRNSRAVRKSPLVYGRASDGWAIVASNGGSGVTPNWLLNLEAEPGVEIQIKTEVIPVNGRVVEGPEREPLWELMLGCWPRYARYQERAGRQLPVVLLSPNLSSVAGRDA